MKLNEKLTELRKAKGLTQHEIAEALDVSRQAVSRWEVGTATPTLDNLSSLSKLYGVPLDHFIQEEAGAKVQETVPADVPPAVPVKTGRSYVTPVCSFLAVVTLGVGILIGGSMQSKPESDGPGFPDTTEGSDVSVIDAVYDQITIFTPEGRYTYSVPSGKTSIEIENRYLRDEDLQKIEEQIAAEQEEVKKNKEAKKNALPRAKLSDENILELAEHYDANAMTQEQYDAFLEVLVNKDVLTREEIGYMGYKGITVVDPARLNEAVVVPMDDPTDQASRNLLWGDYSTGSPISGFLFRNLDNSFDVLAWANMMNTFYNNDTDFWQCYYGAMYDVLDRMSSAREQME